MKQWCPLFDFTDKNISAQAAQTPPLLKENSEQKPAFHSSELCKSHRHLPLLKREYNSWYLKPSQPNCCYMGADGLICDM